MDFEKVMDRAFDMLEKSLEAKGKNKQVEMRRLSEISAEQERTKRMGFSSEERLQNLVNKGLLKRQEVENTGLMNREKMSQAGLTDRTGMKESGLDSRQAQKLDAEASKPIFKESKTKTTDGDSGDITEKSTWQNYNTQAARLAGTGGGGFGGKDRAALLSKATNAASATATPQPESSPPIATERQRDFKTPLENMGRGTGFVEVMDGQNKGKRFDIRGETISESSAPKINMNTNRGLDMPTTLAAPSPTPLIQRTTPTFKGTMPAIVDASLPGGGGQSPLGSNGQKVQPFGQKFIDSNIGHAFRLDQAQRGTSAFYGGMANKGSQVLKAGRKLSDWAMRPSEKRNPVFRKNY